MFVRTSCLLLVVISSFVVPSHGWAETAVLAPNVDNSIHRDWEDLCGTYAPDYPDLVVQSREDLPSVVRSLVLFDLSSIPANGVIVSATLRLYCLLETEYVTNDFHVSRILEPWDTMAVTWCLRDIGTPWSADGGYFTTDDQATVQIVTKYPDPWAGGPYNEWIEWDVTAVADSWYTEEAANYGFCVWQTPMSGHGRNQRVHFASMDNAQAATLGPQLIVEYTAPVSTQPSTWGAVRSLFR